MAKEGCWRWATAEQLTRNRKEDTEKEGAAVTERKRPLLPPAGDGLSMQMTKKEGTVTGSGRLKLGYRKLWQKHTDRGRKEEREKKRRGKLLKLDEADDEAR